MGVPTLAGLGTLVNPLAGAVSRLVSANDVGYDIWLLIGQSNMVGRGTLDVRYDITDPRVYAYNGGGAYASAIVPAFDPLAHNAGESTGVGPGIHFARLYAASVPSNRRVLLVPMAKGGTSIVSWLNAPSLMAQAMTQLTAAIASAGANSRVVGALWVQGEGDSGTSVAANAYQANLDTLIDLFRTTFGAALQFIVGQMTPGWIATSPYAPVVNAAHIDTPRRKLLTGFAYGIAGHDDLTHGDEVWNRYEGEAMFAAHRRAAANVLGTQPVAPTSVTIAQQGTTLNVSWPQSTGRATDYLVEYKLSAAGSWTTLTRAQSIDVTAAITGITIGQTYNVRVSTVNEQGTSAATVATPIVTVNVPGQVVGLAGGTPTTTSIPLTWTATATATSYLAEYRAVGGSTWLNGGTSATTAITVSGLAFSTDYEFRVTASNIGGSGTPSATLTPVRTADPAKLLDDLSVAAYRAYAPRKLRAAYAGPAMRVRRSSDSTEQDIGFVGEHLDAASLLTFAAGGSAFVKTWYDQSGNTRDITQATTTKQPRIVNAGVVDVLNTRPSALFDGVDDFLGGTAPGLYAAGATSALAVLVDAVSSLIFGESSSSSASPYYQPLKGRATTTGSAFGMRNDAGTGLISLTATTSLATTLHQVTMLDTGSAITHRIDGVNSSLNATAYARTGVLTLDTFTVGAESRNGTPGLFVSGSISELVLFASVLSGADQTAGQANQKSYYGTP